MARAELRISGFGGQGVILAAYVLGKAAAVFENRHATLNQSFGPEARGSACSAQLILSDEPISYPYVRRTHVLVSMSQDAYRLFRDELGEDGTMLIDEDLVSPDRNGRPKAYAVPATRLAEKLGKRIVANMVMVGFFTAITSLVTEESVREAIRTSVPSGTEKLNLAAFDAGFEHGRMVLGLGDLEGVSR